MRSDPHRDFVEEAGLIFEELGSSRMTGRVLAWLMVCEPREQSSEELSDAIGVSRGSISTATRDLVRLGMVRRRTRPGSRALYFRLAEDAWTPLMEIRLRTVVRLRELAERGLEAVKPASDSQRERLEGMRDFYKFFAERMPALVQEWYELRRG